MNLAIDIDGCVCNFPKAMTEYTNVRFGIDDDPDKIDKWEWWESGNMKISQIQFDTAFKEFSEHKMWRAIEIYPDVKISLCSLDSLGHNIYYLTARPKSARRATLKYLLQNGLPIDGILFFDDVDDKVEMAKQLNIDIAIEDKPSTIKLYHVEGIRVAARLHAFNKREVAKLNYPYGIDIVESMTDFVKLIQSISNKCRG